MKIIHNTCKPRKHHYWSSFILTKKQAALWGWPIEPIHFFFFLLNENGCHLPSWEIVNKHLYMLINHKTRTPNPPNCAKHLKYRKRWWFLQGNSAVSDRFFGFPQDNLASNSFITLMKILDRIYPSLHHLLLFLNYFLLAKLTQPCIWLWTLTNIPASVEWITKRKSSLNIKQFFLLSS